MAGRQDVDDVALVMWWRGHLTSGPAMSLLQEAETIIQKIKQQQYADLLSHDQLLMERKYCQYTKKFQSVLLELD